MLNNQERMDWLQRYIIVHSYIYYELNDNVISDREYDLKAKELVAMKNKFPELWKKSQYRNNFGDDYNGSTGFNLWYSLDDHQKEIIRSIAMARPNAK